MQADEGNETGRNDRARQDPPLVRWGLTLTALLVLFVLVLLPVIHVFAEALKDGVGPYWDAVANNAETASAIRMTLTVVPIAVCLNLLFGLAAAWVIARFRFRGRSALLSLIDLPFAVSPVVAGLALTLLFGSMGYFGAWLDDRRISILFDTPGIVLATAFVTFPFVARELIPVMEAEGPEEELAAMTLGASGWQMFWRVTLPNIKYGVLYGVILCTARAAGEFGAVYVVSGDTYGKLTLPLRVHTLFEDRQQQQSFAAASLLTILALGTLVIKVMLERAERRRQSVLKAERQGEAS
jgi:sulfate/thiosulfate transport system permease protein